MKNIRNKFLALLVIASVAFSSCKKEDPLAPMRAYGHNNTTNNNAMVIDNNQISDADWKVTSYQAGDLNMTQIFTPYAFNFDKEGILIAVTRKNTVFGTWEIGVKENADKLTIRFPDEFPLNSLNKEWRILNKTAIEVILEKRNRKYVETVVFRRTQRLLDGGQVY